MFLRFVLVGMVSVGIVFAQDRIEPRSSFGINLDFARFNNTDSSKYLELYFACFPQLVTLEKLEGNYRGFVELRLLLKNRLTNTVVASDRSLIVVNVPDTSAPSYRNTLIGQMGYVVPFGNYDLIVVSIDSLASSRRDSIRVPIDITDAGDGFAMSDLELCSTIRQSTKTTDPFYKNSHEVIPNPTLLFGTASNPVIFHYLELYDLDVEETYTIKTIITDDRGRPVQEHSRRRTFGVQRALDVGTTAATKLPSGKYRFQVVVMNSSSEPLNRAEKVFYAYNPHVVQDSAGNAGMKETELSGLSSEELAREFEYARYYATQEEVNTFSKITSLEGQRQFLAKFWSEVEGGKLGHYPVKRSEYLMRVQRANERFRALSREGWRTDRGRVFLLYAAPDEVERVPSNESGKPYEIWSYYQIENGVIFVFVDRMGFGDYTLVHSTKRGELRDDNWQRLLQ